MKKKVERELQLMTIEWELGDDILYTYEDREDSHNESMELPEKYKKMLTELAEYILSKME